MPESGSTANPYVGPRTFEYQDRRLFFGREREARDLLARVLSERLLLFYAQSGAGKSSLLRTRLIPQLQEEKDFVVLPVGRVSGELPPNVAQVDNIFAFNLALSIDKGENPGRLASVKLCDFLARLARKAITDATGQERRQWVYDAALPVATAPSTRRYALIVDQFEEIFTSQPGRWQEREAFFRQLDEAMQIDTNLWVVLVLRQDYVAGLDPYAPLMADRLRGRFYMERMERAAALDAIRKPAELGGRPFAAGAAEQLVDDLRAVRLPGQASTFPGEYVEPVQLQVVCYQLWENLAGRPPGEITAQDIASAGDVDQALAVFYEHALLNVCKQPGLGVREHQLRTWFSTKLITEAGTRGTVYRNEQKGETGGLPNAAVDLLERQFLVRTELRSGGSWVELVHDRFVEPILRANRERQTPLLIDADAWLDEGKPGSKLYSGSHLATIASQVDANPSEYTETEHAFIDAGLQADARRTTRRQRTIVSGAVGLALIFVALAGWALWSRGLARASAAEALTAQVNAEAERIRAVTAEADAVNQSLAAQDALDTAVLLQGRERVARAEAERNLEAAQAAVAAQSTALADLGNALQANLTAQAMITPPPPAQVTRVVQQTPVGTRPVVIIPFITPPPPVMPGPPPVRTPIFTPGPQLVLNPTYAAQATQLYYVRATQTALPQPQAQFAIPSEETPQVPARCTFRVMDEFGQLWTEQRRVLGCPTDPGRPVSPACQQLFEGGSLFWRSDVTQVYIVFDRDKPSGGELPAGRWFVGPRNWGWDGSNPQGLGMQPPPGLFEPVGGLGWLWRQFLGGPEGRLGWATTTEKCAEGAALAQQFEGGIMYRSLGPKVYALFDVCMRSGEDPAWPPACEYRAR